MRSLKAKALVGADILWLRALGGARRVRALSGVGKRGTALDAGDESTPLIVAWQLLLSRPIHATGLKAGLKLSKAS